MSMDNDVLVKSYRDVKVPVISFDRMVDIVVGVHQKLAHVRIAKTLFIVENNFWHPAMREIITDVCASCKQCQLYKNHPQAFAPPIIKIQSAFPYDLVALDLLQFPRSRRGNVALLMSIDHFSKFLLAVPIKDKSGNTVAEAMKNRILPTMTRIPKRVLTDNCPEFKSSVFNNVLEDLNISHVYSSAYKASSNGCIERCNQTVLQLMRGHNVEED